MAFLPQPITKCLMHQFHLQSRFPSLQFTFFIDAESAPDKVTARIRKRGNEGKKAHHDEYVDPETFPDELFITKCILIA